MPRNMRTICSSFEPKLEFDMKLSQPKIRSK